MFGARDHVDSALACIDYNGIREKLPNENRTTVYAIEHVNKQSREDNITLDGPSVTTICIQVASGARISAPLLHKKITQRLREVCLEAPILCRQHTDPIFAGRDAEETRQQTICKKAVSEHFKQKDLGYLHNRVTTARWTAAYNIYLKVVTRLDVVQRCLPLMWVHTCVYAYIYARAVPYFLHMHTCTVVSICGHTL